MDILLFSYQFYAPLIVAPLVMILLGNLSHGELLAQGAICSSVAVIIMLIGGGEHAASIIELSQVQLIGMSAFFTSYQFEQYVTERKEVTT